jgi:tetratricopeptide (TPR) repeat protein
LLPIPNHRQHGGVQRGSVNERPWGLTLASFAAARAHGQLTLTADDGKLYRIAFEGGFVAGASSPMASDGAARVALTSQLVAPEQVPALARAVALSPERDEIEVIAEVAGLMSAEIAVLRRRLLLQRVARTFAVDRGEYTFGEPITVATVRGCSLDVAPAIFRGVLMNLSQDRLTCDLRSFGARFMLRDGGVDADRFGFTEADRPILQALRIGTSLPELEAKRRELEPRRTQVVIYALVAMGLCDGLPQPRSREGSAEVPTIPAAAAAAAAAEVEVDVAEAAVDGEDSLITRARTTTFDRPRPRTADAELRRTRTISAMPPLTSPPSRLLAAGDVVAAGLALLDAGADHFALLGVSRDAAPDEIHTAFVALACHLQMAPLSELEPDAEQGAERLLAGVNAAYAVLSDPAKRAAYIAGLGGRAALAPIPAGTAAERARVAAEVAQRGLVALRREELPVALELLTRAAALAPSDVDYAAHLAWARFCAAPNKAAVAADVCRVLERAVFRSPSPVTARFYLGRVERTLGRVHEALHHFYEVLELEPEHTEAAAEIRRLEPRQARR